MILTTFALDTALLQQQVADLKTALELEVFESLRGDLFRVLPGLFVEVSLREDPSAVLTGGRQNFVLLGSFGNKYHDLLAALRTGELEVARHAIQSIAAAQPSVVTTSAPQEAA